MVINNKQYKNQTKHWLIKKLRTLSFLSTLMLISSCAVYKTGFECPADKGEGCKSVTEVNEMVSRGEIGRNISVWSRDTTNSMEKTQPQEKSKAKKLESKEQRQADTDTKASTDTKISPNTNSHNTGEETSEPEIQNTKKECGC